VPKKKSAANQKPTQAAAVVPRLLDVRGAAQYLSSTVWNIRTLTWEGKLKPVPVGGARLLFDRADLDSFIELVKVQ
jgi:hypothetical protein